MKGRLGLLFRKRRVFTGEFQRWGSRKNWHGKPASVPTLLLTNVCLPDDEEVADHVWVRNVVPFLCLNEIKGGDRFRFEGRVDSFPKDSVAIDFHIVDIENVERVH